MLKYSGSITHSADIWQLVVLINEYNFAKEFTKPNYQIHFRHEFSDVIFSALYFLDLETCSDFFASTYLNSNLQHMYLLLE